MEAAARAQGLEPVCLGLWSSSPSAGLRIAVFAEWPMFVQYGALMFYGADIPNSFGRRRAMLSGSSKANVRATCRSSSQLSCV
jgi:hypothetical protein